MDPSISYRPSTSWNSSGIVCSSCNNPPTILAAQNTYHKGVHAELPDDDDKGGGNDDAPPAQGHEVAKGGGKGDGGSGGGDGGGGGGGDKSNNIRALHLPRLDFDDVGFVDTPVTAEFQFTGTAIYIYCIQPLGLSTLPESLTFMNTTFSLDHKVSSTFVHQGSASNSGFASGVNVFGKRDLSDGPHVVQISLGPNSVFILDYVVYTQNAPDPLPQSFSPKKKGTATFAAALSASLGVLGILCFGTAFSIYRRRLLAARRERNERVDPVPPMMIGPAPFVPRYFPGTVIPSVPPPYAPSDSSSRSSHDNLHAVSQPLLPPHDSRTYADNPPPLDDIAPPSFGVAIASPAATILSSNVSGDAFTAQELRPPNWDAIPSPESRRSTSRAASLFSGNDDRA
ncbi:hypothetical protein C8J57DRAFT_1502718 [Mycena rebaudengoi]|nr:hypothetical protein C8J57DRAFT_1502718 [Mycena rebaudengoi]